MHQLFLIKNKITTNFKGTPKYISTFSLCTYLIREIAIKPTEIFVFACECQDLIVLLYL